MFALGFDFGDSDPPASAPSRAAPSPKAFAAFTLKANSLLVYQGVMRGAVGEALLALMAQSQKYQASNKDIIASYTKFYSLLMMSGYDDWRDYLLDQVLLGRDNPFARAAAQGQVEKNAPILQAVAYDLDTLQGLCVPLGVISDYVGDVAPTAGSYWVSAASAVAVKRPTRDRQQLSGDAPPVKPAVVISDSSSGSGSKGGSPAAAGGSSGGSSSGAGFIQAPPTPEALSEWKAALASHSAWSDALPLLTQYYLDHGYGVTSRNAALRWSKGGFEEASEGGLLVGRSNPRDSSPVTTLSPPAAAAGPAAGQQQAVLPVLQAAYDRLASNTRRHCAGLPACHAVVCGPPGAGKSWLLWEGSLMAGREAGLRIVEVPASEVGNLVDIARGCARYPRVHFILVVDHLELPLRGAGATDLMGALAAAGGSGWPSNTLLYVGVSAASAVSRSDPLVSRCPLVVTLPGIEAPEQYWQTVEALLPAGAAAGEDKAELQAAAEAWGKTQGLSVRSAASFARSCGL